MKKILKKILPDFMIKILKEEKLKRNFHTNYQYDLKRYWKYSGTINSFDNPLKNEAQIAFMYHTIEKGMTLHAPRVGYGKKRVKELLYIIEKTHKRYGPSEMTEVSLNVLDAYYLFNLKHGLKLTDIKNKIDKLKKDFSNHYTNEGGWFQSGKDEIINEIESGDFERFVKSRHSIRDFTDEEVSINDIERAVDLSRKAPSVCNRQTTRVHVYSDSVSKKALLDHQNGNRGFGDRADKILLITADLSVFHEIYERNQAFIDGGLFSMTLVYALHFLGLGTCCLNCSIDYKADQELRRVAKIENAETPIMMIAIGHIPKKIRIAQSHRKPLSDILYIH